MGDRRKKLRRQERKAAVSSSPPGQPPQKLQSAHHSFVQLSTEWQGPLPPPGVLQQFGVVIPTAPERILQMAERQARHRHKMENRDSWTESLQRMIGTISGALVSVIGVGGGIWLIYNDKDISGLAVLAGSLGALVAAVRTVAKAKVKEQAIRAHHAQDHADREGQAEQLALFDASR